MASLDPTTLGLALLAFVVALYALAARDQKTPYITTSVYLTAILVLVGVALSVVAKLLTARAVRWAGSVDIASWAFVSLAIIHALWNIARARNRRLHFRDDHPIKNEQIVRSVKSVWRRLFPPSQYDFNPMASNSQLLDCIRKALPESAESASVVDSPDHLKTGSTSIAYKVGTLDDADQVLIKLVTCFLAQKYSVQYATCTRHPFVFLQKLKQEIGKSDAINWVEVKGNIVAVDAYTPHFGFTDSIHDYATKAMKDEGIKWVRARASYASLHTAAAQAYNKLKRGAKVRVPALIIYDGPYALVDLESPEQYRVFIRHVLPSERLWGGMLTVVVEFGIADQDLAVLRGYADVFFDLTQVSLKQAP